MDKKTITSFAKVIAAAGTVSQHLPFSTEKTELEKAISLIRRLSTQAASCVYEHDHFSRSDECEAHS